MSQGAGREALGIDLGGTKVLLARVDEAGRIMRRERIETPHDDAVATLHTIAEAARGLIDGCAGVGMGVAGMVDDDGVVRFGPNLGWTDVPAASELRDALGLPVLVDNDANAAAWGEFRAGAANGTAHALVVTVGTGIGGGVILDGRLFRGAHGMAAEIGHVIVEPGGPVCPCGNHGCWETMASGTAIGRAARDLVAAGGGSALLVLAEGDPSKVDGHTVTQAAVDGDAEARAILATVGKRLGEGLAGLVNIFDPELVVVGGGVADAGDLLLAPARSAFNAALEAPDLRPKVPVVPAELGNDAGAIGAALLVLDGEDAAWGTVA